MTAVGTATHSCELRSAPPSDDLEYWFVEVVKGDVVVGSGMGDTIVDALLGVIEYMLPPDHPEYPKDQEYPKEPDGTG